MNRERTKELLPVFQAFADGENIQRFWNDTWHPEIGPMWTGGEKYRIKPKPREFWVNPDKMSVWSTKGTDNDCIKVREVLDE